MPQPPEPTQPTPGGLLWVGSLLSLAVVAVGVLSYRAAGEANAKPGSPLYNQAVHEAIQGLKGGAAQTPAAGQRPPLPAGLSPADYYWCDKCQQYHKRQPDAATPAAPAAAPAAEGSPPAGQAAAPPPLPAGLSPADYYWCEKCKAYHKRDAGQANPAAPAPVTPPAAPAAAPAPATPPAAPADPPVQPPPQAPEG